MPALETEFETYLSKLLSLLDHEGKFILVCRTDIDGVFNTYCDAISAGYNKYGVNIPFLVKQINANDQVAYLNRDVSIA